MKKERKGKHMKKIVLIVIIVFVLILGTGFYGMFFLGMGSTYYYTQIDNTKFTENSSGGVVDLSGGGGLENIYTLTAYDDNGKEREIVFGSSRQLREGAFIRLTVFSMRGVTDWEEVQTEELPERVREIYSVS